MSTVFTPRRRSACVAMALASALLVTGCGGDSGSTADPGASAGTPSASTSSAPPTTAGSASPGSGSSSKAAAPVPALLDFAGRTVAGDDFRGSTLAGKPVVLWFWAPWCAVCRSQAPQVEKLVADFGADLSVIGIGSLDSGSAISGFAEDVSGPVHLSDPDGDLWKRFRISEQSSFVVLDASGEEVLRTGYNDDDRLRGTVEELVG